MVNLNKSTTSRNVTLLRLLRESRDTRDLWTWTSRPCCMKAEDHVSIQRSQGCLESKGEFPAWQSIEVRNKRPPSPENIPAAPRHPNAVPLVQSRMTTSSSTDTSFMISS